MNLRGNEKPPHVTGANGFSWCVADNRGLLGQKTHKQSLYVADMQRYEWGRYENEGNAVSVAGAGGHSWCMADNHGLYRIRKHLKLGDMICEQSYSVADMLTYETGRDKNQ